MNEAFKKPKRKEKNWKYISIIFRTWRLIIIIKKIRKKLKLRQEYVLGLGPSLISGGPGPSKKRVVLHPPFTIS